MSIERFLGAAWAAIRGPSEPAALAAWTLDNGFCGLLPAPAPRPLDWVALHALAERLPFRLPAVRLAAFDAGDDRPDADLCSANSGERATAMTAVRGAVELAARLGIERVILEPGHVAVHGEPGPTDLGDAALGWTQDVAKAQLARRNAALDRALEHACRTLFEICKAFPEMMFCLTPSRSVTGLGEPRALGAIFEDLPNRSLYFWHDAAIAARRMELLGEEQGEWLELFAPRTVGVTLGDTADGLLNLPPGAGAVDYPLLGTYMRTSDRELFGAIELDAAVDVAELGGLRSFLTKFGL